MTNDTLRSGASIEKEFSPEGLTLYYHTYGSKFSHDICVRLEWLLANKWHIQILTVVYSVEEAP